jgi:hypothetical protein
MIKEENLTENKFLVAAIGDKISLLRLGGVTLEKDDALNLAAWIVAMSDPLEEKFPKVLEEVMST